MNGRLTFIPAGVLLVGVLLISGIREQHAVPPREPMKAIPTTFAGLVGRDTTVSEEERKVAGMSDYVMRLFNSDTTVFSVYVGYYDRQVQGTTIHSPKNCLPGAGWEIMQNEKVEIPTANGPARVNRVLLGNNGVRALVYYWYQGRGRIESSEYRVKWDLLRDAALYGRTEEALVRIVVPAGRTTSNAAADTALTRAQAVALQVVTPLAAAVDRVLPLPQKD